MFICINWLHNNVLWSVTDAIWVKWLLLWREIQQIQSQTGMLCIINYFLFCIILSNIFKLIHISSLCAGIKVCLFAYKTTLCIHQLRMPAIKSVRRPTTTFLANMWAEDLARSMPVTQLIQSLKGQCESLKPLIVGKKSDVPSILFREVWYETN